MNKLDPELEQIFHDYRQQLFTYAMSIVRSPDGAEDVIQDAFYQLFCMVKIPSHWKAYVFRTIRNTAIDHLRQKRTYVELDHFIFDPKKNPSESADQREFLEKVSRAFLMLTEDERETVVSHLYSELTFREISEIRVAPLGTVTSWYQRGIQKLKEFFEKDDQESHYGCI